MCAHMHMYALRIVSTIKIFYIINTFIIITNAVVDVASSVNISLIWNSCSYSGILTMHRFYLQIQGAIYTMALTLGQTMLDLAWVGHRLKPVLSWAGPCLT